MVLAITRGQRAPIPPDVSEHVDTHVTDLIATCLSVDPAARPSAAAALCNPAAVAALATFRVRAKAFGGVNSNVRENGRDAGEGWGGRLQLVGVGPPDSATSSTPSSPHEPGTPLPGVIPGTPGHAPSWGEAGTGCFTWGLGMNQPMLDRAVLECDWLSLVSPAERANENAAAAATGAQPVVHIAFGRSHKTAVTSNGAAVCWAYGDGADVSHGQLGHGSLHPFSKPRALASLGPSAGLPVIAVACGDDHTLALVGASTSGGGGLVYSWGCGSSGRLGVGDEDDRLVPTPVAGVGVSSGGLLGVHGERCVAVACGGEFSMALGASGAIYTWGEASAGQLGHSGSGVDDGRSAHVVGGVGGGNYEGMNDETEDGEVEVFMVLVPRKICSEGLLATVTVTAIACGYAHAAAVGVSTESRSITGYCTPGDDQQCPPNTSPHGESPPIDAREGEAPPINAQEGAACPINARSEGAHSISVQDEENSPITTRYERTRPISAQEGGAEARTALSLDDTANNDNAGVGAGSIPSSLFVVVPDDPPDTTTSQHERPRGFLFTW